MRRALVLAVIVPLVMAGCGGNKTKETTAKPTTPTSAPAEGISVVMDGRTSAYNGVFTAYFPSQVSVHPGATVDFKMPSFNGEPHTVTLGTLVDAGVKKLESLGPKATFADQENTAELKNLPDVFPHEPGAGPPDANQSAALPCYLDSGVPPLSLTGSAPPCPKRDQPEFNGRQAFYNSGLLAQDNALYSVKLSNAIPPGTYGVFCLIHRGGMFGTLNVLDKATPVATATEVTAKGTEEFNTLAKSLQPAAAPPATATPGAVLAGALAPDVINGLVAQFIPANVTIAAGQSVTWQVFFFHTISFNRPPDASPLVTKSPDGTLHLNPEAFGPSNSPPLPAAYEAFPPKASKPYLLNGGTFDGAGYKNTGLVGSIPPSIVSYKVAFTKPGTYSYVCLIHPAMAGSVTVT